MLPAAFHLLKQQQLKSRLTSQKFFNKNKEDQTLQPECLEGTQLPAHRPATRGHHLNALCNMLFKKPKTYRSQAEDSCGNVW